MERPLVPPGIPSLKRLQEPGKGCAQTHLPGRTGILKDKTLHPLLALLEEPGAAVVWQGELLDHQVVCCAHLLPQVQLGLCGGWESTATAEDAAVLGTHPQGSTDRVSPRWGLCFVAGPFARTRDWHFLSVRNCRGAREVQTASLTLCMDSRKSRASQTQQELGLAPRQGG